MKKRKTTFERLKEKIKKDTGIDAYDFRCLHTGSWQKSNGAWSWSAYTSFKEIGSPYSATLLLKCSKLELVKIGESVRTSYEIYPI